MFDTFAHLDRYLPPQSLLVFNDTKVVPARALLTKDATGGKVEVLFLMNEWDGKGPVPTIADRKLSLGTRVSFRTTRSSTSHGPSFTVVGQDEQIFFLKPEFPARDLLPALMRYGITPLPKYIKHPGARESALRKHYQTVFGTTPASVAAPTASLHFTDRLLKKLDRRDDLQKTFVTLHVGMGTFAPVRPENIAQGTLHKERFEIPAKSRAAIRAQKRGGAPVVAVGTTVVRTLESQAKAILSPHASRSNAPLSGDTQLFIRPPHQFGIVDALITNFHLPSTSLMMLVEAFLEQKGASRHITELYRIAIKEQFRFYSFGDGMLIL